jgi:hypothetical protein
MLLDRQTAKLSMTPIRLGAENVVDPLLGPLHTPTV